MKISELKAEIVRNEMILEEFADKAGIERTTLWRRFSNPDSFTLGEITRMAKLLNLNAQRVVEIFFTDYVA